METIRYRPVKIDRLGYRIDLGCLIEDDCKELYRSGEINDSWDIEILIPNERTIIEKPSTLWDK